MKQGTLIMFLILVSMTLGLILGITGFSSDSRTGQFPGTKEIRIIKINGVLTRIMDDSFLPGMKSTDIDFIKEQLIESKEDPNIVGVILEINSPGGTPVTTREISDYVIEFKKEKPIVFDEFQNFFYVAPQVYGILQKEIDLNENNPGLIILLGSLLGLMKKTFTDQKEPLYGRIKKSIKLDPLSLCNSLKLSNGLKLGKEDALKFYCLFGGYPKYYTYVEDYNLENKSYLLSLTYRFGTV